MPLSSAEILKISFPLCTHSDYLHVSETILENILLRQELILVEKFYAKLKFINIQIEGMNMKGLRGESNKILFNKQIVSLSDKVNIVMGSKNLFMPRKISSLTVMCL